MSLNVVVLILVWLIALGMLILIPKEKKRVSQAAFLFKQMMTWILGLIVVEYDWIEYPVRIFPSVNRTSFTFEFFAYPAVCGLFNAYYPASRGKWLKIGYYFLFSSGLTIVEVMIEQSKRLNLITYIHWSWALSWLSFMLTFFFSHLFCVWFFRKDRV